MVYIVGEDNFTPKENIYQCIIHDKNVFLRNHDVNALECIRVILGEIQRTPDKDYSDENVTKILKSLRKMCLKSPIKDELLVHIIDTYLPSLVDDKTMLKYVYDNYTVDEIKAMGNSAFRIIGETKKHFAPREINVDLLKEEIGMCIG